MVHSFPYGWPTALPDLAMLAAPTLLQAVFLTQSPQRVVVLHDGQFGHFLCIQNQNYATIPPYLKDQAYSYFSIYPIHAPVSVCLEYTFDLTIFLQYNFNHRTMSGSLGYPASSTLGMLLLPQDNLQALLHALWQGFLTFRQHHADIEALVVAEALALGPDANVVFLDPTLDGLQQFLVHTTGRIEGGPFWGCRPAVCQALRSYFPHNTPHFWIGSSLHPSMLEDQRPSCSVVGQDGLTFVLPQTGHESIRILKRAKALLLGPPHDPE